jgi:hypothetical protein
MPVWSIIAVYSDSQDLLGVPHLPIQQDAVYRPFRPNADAEG